MFQFFEATRSFGSKQLKENSRSRVTNAWNLKYWSSTVAMRIQNVCLWHKLCNASHVAVAECLKVDVNMPKVAVALL
ncbi:hypothetical protein SLA2020_455650 [Shorea laevis]